MRERCRRISSIPLTLVVMLLLLPEISGCAFATHQISLNNQHVTIDRVDFIRFGGIMYTAVTTNVEHPETASDLGPVFAKVAFKLDGHVQDPEYQSKDGDAAFLDAGTEVYSVKGYRSTFRLAAYENHTLTLYEADTNPRARTGSDLLDIAGKVRFIGVVNDQYSVNELGTIKDPMQVHRLVDIVLQAPVDQNHQPGKQRYFVLFHLEDSTVVTRAYWLDTGEMARGILLPRAFGLAIKALLPVNYIPGLYPYRLVL